MLWLVVRIQSWLSDRLDVRDQRGQATAEYALLLVGVAAIALLVAAWAARSGRIGELLDRVFDAISSRVG